MPATGKHLKIIDMGDNVLGVKLLGNPKKPEPIHFRLMFPGGDVEVVRTTDNKQWVHIRVDHPEHPSRHKDDGKMDAQISTARLDILGKGVNDADVGDVGDPDLYHMAVLVEPTEEKS